MEREFRRQAGRFEKRHRGHRVWKRAAAAVCCAALLCSNFMQILPVRALERTLICENQDENHVHEDSCYQALELACTYRVHRHGESCKDEAGNIVCGQADFAVHSHNDFCYDGEGLLVCTLPEIEAHTHDESCYAPVQPSGHTHTDACYTIQRGALICTEAEVPAHAHTDACNGKTLTCQQEETAAHTHDDACKGQAKICALEETEGHIHTEACRSTELTCTIPEHSHAAECSDAEGNLICQQEEHAHEAACHTENIICGLTESEAHTHGEGCYQIANVCGLEETEGHAHGDACYSEETTILCGLEETAGHTHTDACYEQGERTLTCGLEESTADGADASGNTTENDNTTENAQRERICTKTEIALHTHYYENGCYDNDGNLICTLPEVQEHIHSEDCCVEKETLVLEAQTLTAQIYTDATRSAAAEDTVSITVSGELPEDAQIVAYPASVENALCAYDISILLADDSVYSPENGEFTVSINSEELIESLSGTSAQVYYVPVDGEMEAVDTELTEEGITFTTTHFSVYAAFANSRVSVSGLGVNDAWDSLDLAIRSAESGATVVLEQDVVIPSSMTYATGTWETNATSGNVIDVNSTTGAVTITGGSTTDMKNLTAVAFNNSFDTQAMLTNSKVPNYVVSAKMKVERPESNPTAATTIRQGILPWYRQGNAYLCLAPEWKIAVDGTTTFHGVKLYGLFNGNAIYVDDLTTDTVAYEAITDWYTIPTTAAIDASLNPYEEYTMVIHRQDSATALSTNEKVPASLTLSYAMYNSSGTEVIAGAVNVQGNDWLDISGKVGFYSGNPGTVKFGSLRSDAPTANGNQSTSVWTIDKALTIDLNGHSITQGQGKSLFAIASGGSLTITDNKQPAESVSSAGFTNQYGQQAVFADGENPTLTYYKVTSAITNASIGATIETIETHTVPVNNGIKASDEPVFLMQGGNLTINSGMIYGGSDRAIYSDNAGGSVTLAGGYIFGFDKPAEEYLTTITNVPDTGIDASISASERVAFNRKNLGGAINLSGTSLTITGGVLAANSAASGGAVYMTNANFSMSGGVISGNDANGDDGIGSEQGTGGLSHFGGGGILMDSGTVATISGGYITCNVESQQGDMAKYFDGGGAVMLKGANTTLTMSGGYVTGNEASGGGGIHTVWGSTTVFNMTGGHVSANRARSAEGGGISINSGSYAYFTPQNNAKIYVTNNRTDANQHWGGGGIFISGGAESVVYHLLVTDNDAGGFGGGVAGCSTGRIHIFMRDGAAIYGNSALGQHMSGKQSQKDADRLYALNNAVFMSQGYEDYFCALDTEMSGGMLGGYPANWQGSADGVPVTSNSADDMLVAAYMMGLTANPSSMGIAAAQEKAEVFVNGNYSYTHGGGVLVNGYLVTGLTEDIELATSLELQGKKTLLDSDGTPIKEMEEGKFTFSVIDADTGAVVADGYNRETGDIFFKELLSFKKAGTYTYYVRENNPEDASVTWDTTVYRLTVTVERIPKENIKPRITFAAEIKRYQYEITNLTIARSSDGKTWTELDSFDPIDYDYTPTVAAITGDSTFTNMLIGDTTSFAVSKEWDVKEGTTIPQSVTVQLYQNGTAMEGKTVTLSASNSWYHIWEELPAKDTEGNAYTYSVKENDVPGYIAKYTNQNLINSGGIFVPMEEGDTLTVGGQYLLVSPEGTTALYRTSAHSDKGFTSEDTVTVSKGNGSYQIDGVTYTDYYLSSVVSPVSIYTATSIKGSIVMAANSSSTSCLLIQAYPNEENTETLLKDCNNYSYGSLFTYRNGMLVGEYGWDNAPAEDGGYVIVYRDGQFNAVPYKDYSEGAVKVYKFVSATSTSQPMVVITNRQVENMTYSLDVTKLSGIDNVTKLSGAKFQLLDSKNTPVSFVKTSATSAAYSLAAADAEGAVTELVTDGQGKLVLSGLPAGTYTLKETVAPKGYELAKPETVTLSGSNYTKAITITDPPIDFSLPATGGMGTTLFYVVGGVLVVAAIILLVAKKRMKDDE